MYLSYYDYNIRFSIIDIMHNMFLGTPKRIIYHWIENGLISKRSLEDVQDTVKRCMVFSSVGRIPCKIAS